MTRNVILVILSQLTILAFGYNSQHQLYVVTLNVRLGYRERLELWKHHYLHVERNLFRNPASYLLSTRPQIALNLAQDWRVASVESFPVQKKSSFLTLPSVPHLVRSVSSRHISKKNEDNNTVEASGEPAVTTFGDLAEASGEPAMTTFDLQKEVELICHGDPLHEQRFNTTLSVDLLDELASGFTKNFLNSEHDNDFIELEVTTLCFYNALDCPRGWTSRENVLQTILGEDSKFVDDVSSEGASRVLVLRLPSTVNVCNVAKRLARRHNIVHIELLTKYTPLNSFSAAAIQSGAEESVNQENAVVWRAGFLGQGEVVGVGDTGVDIDSCYFREQLEPVNSSSNDSFTQKAGTTGAACDMSRRKIVCYYTTPKATFGDDASMLGGGHGTHVTGTVGGLHSASYNGSALSPVQFLEHVSARSSEMNGIAPLCKLSVNDLGGEGGRLYPPVDFATSPFLSAPYSQAGMRIHSNSWGCGGGSGKSVRTCNKYSVLARSMDGKLTSAKHLDYSNLTCIAEFMWLNKDALLVVAAGNAGDVGNVDLDSQALPRYRDGYYTVGGPATFKNGLAVGATQRGQPNRACASADGDGEPCSFENLFTASSRGPTLDGRIKPEIVFPGEKIVSAFSSGQSDDNSEGTCALSNLFDGVHVISGTSMSCPGTAGAIALIRQYYRETNPATGLKTGLTDGPLSDGYGPSGALLKATLIAGAAPLSGHFTFRSASNAPRLKMLISEAKNPEYLAGFGRPQLDRVLRLDPASSVRLLVFDRHALGNSDDPHIHRIRVSASGRWKAVLTYTDSPGPVQDAWESARVLVNDLDLAASCTSPADCSVSDQDLKSESRIDNIEMLPRFDGKINSVEAIRDTTVTIRVTPRSVHSEKQPYALVVVGTRLEFIEDRSASPNWTPDWGTAVKQPSGGRANDVQSLAKNIAVSVVSVLALITCITGIWYCCRKQEPERKAMGDEVDPINK